MRKCSLDRLNLAWRGEVADGFGFCPATSNGIKNFVVVANASTESEHYETLCATAIAAVIQRRMEFEPKVASI